MRRVCCLALVILIGVAADGWCSFKSIGKDQVNIRSGPGLKYKVLFLASTGYPVEILKKKQNWVQIKDWEGYTGWVNGLMLSDIRTAVVLPERANVRSNPSLRSEVVEQVEKGDIFKVIDMKKNWIRIGYYYGEEPVGWIRQDLVFGD
jgi:SH3-like domain-containing protein